MGWQSVDPDPVAWVLKTVNPFEGHTKHPFGLALYESLLTQVCPSALAAAWHSATVVSLAEPGGHELPSVQQHPLYESHPVLPAAP